MYVCHAIIYVNTSVFAYVIAVVSALRGAGCDQTRGDADLYVGGDGALPPETWWVSIYRMVGLHIPYVTNVGNGSSCASFCVGLLSFCFAPRIVLHSAL